LRAARAAESESAKERIIARGVRACAAGRRWVRVVRRDIARAPANVVQRPLRDGLLEQSLVGAGAPGGKASRQISLPRVRRRRAKTSDKKLVPNGGGVSHRDARVARGQEERAHGGRSSPALPRQARITVVRSSSGKSRDALRALSSHPNVRGPPRNSDANACRPNHLKLRLFSRYAMHVSLGMRRNL